MLVGLIINPVAGMGGSVALKGTDGSAYQEALSLGATAIAPSRARRALARISGDVTFLTASGGMGQGALTDLGFSFEVVYNLIGESGPSDTVAVCKELLTRNTELIIFCGGDGTARDVMDVVSENIPCIGIPSGVKMHSAVFANTPEEAGEVANAFIHGDTATKLAEVMDVDEVAFRQGELKARLYGYLRVPLNDNGMQPPKGSVFASNDDEQKEVIAQYVVDSMEKDTVYVLGPGTTTKAIADKMGLKKTLLGVDVYRDGALLWEDASEADLLRAVKDVKVKLVLTPIGHQGFVLGRGNQQISPRVVETVGMKNIQIIATPEKLRETNVLRSDSGDTELDLKMRGYQKVLVGYAQYRMVHCA